MWKVIIGIIIVLALAVFFAVLTCKSKKSDLYKWIGIAIFVALALTWVLPYGYFSSGSFASSGMNRLGLSDIPTILYYGFYFCLTTIIYFFIVGGFYGVLSKTKSYKALVKKCAKVVKNHQMLSTIVMIVLLVCLTSVTKSALNMLVLLPFLVSILLNAKFDKVTATGVTFGSLLVGQLAATVGTDGLKWFNSYLSLGLEVGRNYRFILAAITLVLFVGYNIFRVQKVVKKNKEAQVEDDVFAIEDVKTRTKVWPAVVVLLILFAFVILAYIDWKTLFGIELFENIHEKIIEFSLFKTGGEEFNLFSYILGTNAQAFGAMEITSLVSFLLVMSLIIALMNKMSLSELVENFTDGIKKMAKPVTLYALTYVVFIITYMDPFTATISNWAFGLTKTFNPFTTSLAAFITSIFHADLGYTSYIISSVVSANFTEQLPILHTIYVFMYGLVQLLLPVGGLLLVGLSYMKIDYKAWFKYIWMFAAAMTIVFVIFISIVTYVL